MESALGHTREHFDHRVGTLLLVHVAKPQHIRAVCKESAAQEGIHEEYIADLQRGRQVNTKTQLFLFVEVIFLCPA